MRRVAVPLELSPQEARPREGRPLRLSGPTMAVGWSLQGRAPAGLGDDAVAGAVQQVCDTVVAQMSNWEPESDLSRFNRAAAGSWVDIPRNLATVLGQALALAADSGGAFDPSVGRLVDLWGFGPAGAVGAAPSAETLEAAACGWRGLELDRAGGRLLQPGGLELDLSGIAKGYAVDLAAEALTALGVHDFLMEIGGELRGAGVKGDGEPWWVELEPPPGQTSAEPPILIALHGLSVATSGDWRRTATFEGRHYSHTIDPARRAPTDGGLASVSVLHPSCMLADGLCTVLMALGPAAEAYAREREVMAHLVARDGGGFREVVSPSLERLLD